MEIQDKFKRKYIPVNIAASEIGVSAQHIYTLLKAGHLKAIDISESGRGGANSIRILRTSIEDFAKSRIINSDKYFE